MRFRSAAACALALAAMSIRSFALEPTHQFRHIGSNAGLSHNSVFAILQDRDGFLWFGTADGLNRYDGYEFAVYRHDPSDPNSLSNNTVKALLEDRDGNLWIGTSDGLNRFDRGRERFFRHPLDFACPEDQQDIHTIFQGQEGTLWVGTSSGLFQYEPESDSFVAYWPDPDDPEGLQYSDVTGIQEDPAGRLWVLASTADRRRSTLHRFVPETCDFVRFRLQEDWGIVLTFLIDRSGGFWINEAGPVQPDDRSGRFPSPRFVGTLTWAICEGRQMIWIGTQEGVFRFDPASRILESLASKAWLQDMARAVYEDRSGILWVGTHAGLLQYDPYIKPFSVLRQQSDNPNSLSLDQVSAINEDAPGSLWVATFGGGLNRLNLATGRVDRYWHRADDQHSLSDNVVWALHRGRNGTLWIGTESGLCSYIADEDLFIRHEGPRFPEAADEAIIDIDEDPQGRIWLASLSELRRYDPKTGDYRLYTYGSDQPRTDFTPGPIHVESADIVWIGGNRLGLNELHVMSGRVDNYPLVTTEGTRLHGEGFWDIHRDSSGLLWLGTSAGLSRFDPRTKRFKHYYQSDGLPGSVVYSILEDEQKRLWLGTNQGLACFDDRLPVGRKFRNFSSSDGVGSTEFNRRAAFRSRRGEFFFGGMGGLTAFFPNEIRENPYIPPIAFTRIQKWNRKGVTTIQPFGLDDLVLSHRDYTFSFEFVALSFTNPMSNQYAYILEGFDEDWVEAGTRRFAGYTNVPPGDYVFKVKGSNNDGVWNEEGTSIALTITPPFWQTWWFRVLAAAVLAAALISAYRYRVARLLELERLRLRIAGDLHDDLSSNLSGIALMSEMVQQESRLDERSRRRLSRITRTAQQMVEDLRDIVWLVDPGHDRLDDLQQKMRDVAERLLGGTSYSFRTVGNLPPDALSMEFRRNAFLIYKEILHNVVRHARATNVAIEVSGNDKGLVLCISDDGVGYDPSAVRQGHGLKSLKSRASDLGGTLEIETRPGEGTRVVLSAKIT